MRTKFTQAARKHRIGKAHVLFVINSVEPTETVSARGEAAMLWVGADDRGVVLEILGVKIPDGLLVIHVMPEYR